MSKGLKMESSRKKDAGGCIFYIDQLNKSDNKNLKCSFCDAEVQYTSAHQKGASKIPVAAYLRLRKENEHSDNCRYSVKGSLEMLVADSNAIEDILPIFEPKKDGSYLFRMNILVEAQKICEDLSSVDSNVDSSERIFHGRNYVRTEQHLASYFRSASGIAKLRALIQDSSSIDLLKRLVRIQYKDNFINWSDFYYDETRYHILFNRLEKNSLPHPVAINLTIKGKASYFGAAKLFMWSYQCHSDTTCVDGKKLTIIPRIQLAKESFVSQILPDNTYLVVGKVWIRKITDEKSFFRNINISIFNKYQFRKEIENNEHG